MSSISIDHSQLERNADAMDKAVEIYRQDFARIKRDVQSLSEAWKGKDYLAYQAKWDEFAGKNSPTEKAIAMQEEMSKFLRYAAVKYKQAQAHAITKATK